MTLLLILIIIALVAYYYYRSKGLIAPNSTSDNPHLAPKFAEIQQINQTLASFLKHELGGQDLKELRTKLNGKTLDEILEENETWENQVDTLTRAKRELEAEVVSLTNAWKNRMGEKERTITRLQADLHEEKKQVSKKAKLLDEEQAENNQLTHRIEALEKEIAQLRRDNG